MRISDWSSDVCSSDLIQPVLLQHPGGYRALQSGQVDAWAGLDPHMAKAELESGARLFFRNADLNTYGILNVRESFAEEYPETVARVLKVYERARHFALEHPEELQARSEEPTSELQSLMRNSYAVFCLKKKIH